MGTRPTHAANMQYLDKLVSLLLSEVFSLSIILRLEYCSGELPLDLVGVFFFFCVVPCGSALQSAWASAFYMSCGVAAVFTGGRVDAELEVSDEPKRSGMGLGRQEAGFMPRDGSIMPVCGGMYSIVELAHVRIFGNTVQTGTRLL